MSKQEYDETDAALKAARAALAFGTLLTLFVIPTAYTLLARQRSTPAVETVFDAEARAALPR